MERQLTETAILKILGELEWLNARVDQDGRALVGDAVTALARLLGKLQASGWTPTQEDEVRFLDRDPDA